MRRVNRGLFFVGILAGLWLVQAGERGAFIDADATAHYGRSRTVDIKHYVLDLAFDPEEREVSGRVAITLSAIARELQTVELDAGEMTIEAVLRDGAGQDFRHSGEVLRVTPDVPLVPGEDVTLEIRYRARPRRGLYFVGPDEAYPETPSQLWSQGESEDSRYWFPCFDYPSDRATSEEIYTVPGSWTAVGNGELLDERENGDGTRTFHYRMEVPHVSYLISVVAGEFEKYTDEWEGIPIEYLVPPGTGKETAMRSFGRTPDMLRFFSEKSGVPYPYPRYAQACAVGFIFGGMENISASTQNVETLHDATAALEFDSLGLVAHEAAHQWWGDLLTCASWPHAWLNEGFAAYWENLWRESAQGRDEFLYRMLLDREDYLEEDRTEYRRAIVEHRYTEPMDLFDSHLYPKGGWVLHMIRGILGDDGFFRSMAHYTRKHRAQIVETADLRRAIAEATGVDLERFFEQWIHRAGYPELVVGRSWDDEQKILTLRFEQRQAVDAETPLFWLPLTIEAETSSGTERRRVVVERVSQDVTLRLSSEPTAVRVDPEFSVLMELELERSTPELIDAVRRDPNPAGRILAGRQLASQASREQALRGLAPVLDADAFYGVRIEAAKSLAGVGGPAARAALVRALTDRDARVRAAAAKALGSFRDDADAAAALRRFLGSERAYGAYAAGVLSMARIGAEDAREVAHAALGRDSHRERIRAAALAALAEVGDEKEIERVREWCAYGKPDRVRRAAVAALARLVEDGDEAKPTSRYLTGLLEDPSTFVRREAMKGLALLGGDDALAALERSARADPNARTRRQARLSAAKIRGAGADAGGLEELGAEIERLRRELRYHSERIDEVEKQGP